MSMGLWQPNAKDEIEIFIREYVPVKDIILSGSMLEPESLDIYSDVDMSIFLPDDVAFDANYFVKALDKRFLSLLGYEVHEQNDRHNNNDHFIDVLRLCFENGWCFDLTFNYTQKRESQIADSLYFESEKKVINQFWFIAVYAIKKIGRKDFLVAAHLALELCQLHIVFQMLLRDRKKKTNIHRFGDGEDVPILHSLLTYEYYNDDTNNYFANIGNKIINIVINAAQFMENISSILPNYKNRYRKFMTIYRELIK